MPDAAVYPPTTGAATDRGLRATFRRHPSHGDLRIVCGEKTRCLRTETASSAAWQLQAFTRQSAMMSPQVFDGKGWKNDISTKFGIRRIPAMWLVDEERTLLDMHDRRNIEANVAKLLAQSSVQIRARPLMRRMSDVATRVCSSEVFSL